MTDRTQVPDGWKVVRLGDVAEVQSGVGFPLNKQGRLSGAYPFIKVSDMTLEGNETYIRRAKNYVNEEDVKELGANIFTPDTIVFPKVGAAIATNKKRVLTVPTIVDNNMVGVSVSKTDRCDARFLHNWFESIDLAQLANVSTVPSITGSHLKRTPILLPPLTEQRAIAAVLDSIDEAIERTEEVTAATERLRDSLLHRLLTRGVPGCHNEWKEAPGIGTIPACWAVVCLGDEAEVRNGTTPSRRRLDYWEGGDIPFVKTGQVNDVFIDEPDEFITAHAVASGAVIVPKGCVLIAMIGQGKTRGMTAQLRIDAAINQNFAAVFGAKEDFSLDYFFTWARQNYSSIRALGQGSNQDALNCALIEGMRVPKPTLAEQQTIVAVTKSMDDAIEQARQERNGLQMLKASAADALLTGRVRVIMEDRP